MIIKILSMHRVVNYGSFMQAYALKSYLSNLGHKVSFVDFTKGEARHKGEKVRSTSTAQKIRKLPKLLTSPSTLIKRRQFKNRMTAVFTDIAWPILGLGELSLNYACDLFIIGSDEVFNYTQNHAFGYVPAFFGHNINADHIISYAASAGYTDLQDIYNDGMENELASGFANFDAISVRDENTYRIVQSLTKSAPTMVLDPTLIYDFSSEISNADTPIKQERILLIYAYTGRLDSKDEVDRIKAYAKNNSLRIVSVGFYHEWCDDNLVVTPFELLKLFNIAHEVITDTFHGTIFSIINKKPFLSLIRHQNIHGSNSNKLGFLLSQLGLTSRLSPALEDIENDMSVPIDYEAVYNRLAPLQNQSREFLQSAVAAASH